MAITLKAIPHKRFYLLILLMPFAVYWNAINNEFGMDDYYVTEGNPKVEEGITGIPTIFTSYYATSDEQQYEYRPLVQTSFAIEKSLFRNLPASQTIEQKQENDVLTQANISHFINIILYAINALLLFIFLSKILKQYHILLPLGITILFIVHPIHAEVVNNLKSRDELFMMAFLLSALIYAIKYALSGLKKPLILSGVLIFLGLLSKLSAFAIFGLVPFIFYYLKAPRKRIFMSWLVMGAFLSLVLLMRTSLPGEPFREFQFFENPLFVEDNLFDRIMLGLYSSFFYLKTLVFPDELSFYYGYNQIPLADFSFWQVWVGALLIPLGIYGIVRWWKRDALGLAIILWLGVMVGSVNFTYPMVGIVAERFAYIFSIGFLMMVGIVFWRGYAFAKAKLNPNTASIIVGILFLIITVALSVRTMDRNEDWEDRVVLFRNDIHHLQDSYRAHTFLADELFVQLPYLVKTQNGTDYVREAEALYKRAVTIDDRQSNPWNNLGAISYMYYEDYEKAKENFEEALRIDPSNIETMLNLAYAQAETGQYDKSVSNLEQALMLDPQLKPAWTYLLSLVKKPQAQSYLQQVFSTLPKKNKEIIQVKEYWTTVGQFYGLKNNAQVAVDSFAKAFLIDTSDKRLGNEVVRLYSELGDIEKAAYFKKQL